MKNSLLFISIIVFIACSSSKKANENSTRDVKSNHENVADSVYSIRVSFISIGSGIDRIARQKYESYIKEFEEQNKIIILLEKINWGREGEINYCINVTNLNKNLQKKFLEGTKNNLKDSKLVRIKENTSCK
jgi:hypothetical protein